MECIVPSILFHKILSIYSLSVAKKSKIKNARYLFSSFQTKLIDEQFTNFPFGHKVRKG